MKTLANTSAMIACVLLHVIIAGAFFNAASAAAHEGNHTESTLAEDVTDEATLKQLVRHAKIHYSGLTFEGLPEFRAATRRNDGVWKSEDSSIYLIYMDPTDGQVFIHGNDRNVEDRTLFDLEDGDPSPEEIESAGIDLQALEKLKEEATEKPETVVCGDYNLTAVARAPACAVLFRIDNLNPGNRFLVGGFAHPAFPVQTVFPGAGYESAITAAEVNGRDTVKKFVEEASKAYEDFFGDRKNYCNQDEDGNYVVNCKHSKRLLYHPIMRLEDGPWKSGSIYLFRMFDVNEEVVFNANNRELEGATLFVEDENGVKVGQEIFAAVDNPEKGGFVEYLWDDPTVDGDEVTGEGKSPGRSPKISYVKISNTITRSDGTEVNSIIGSGIYPKDGGDDGGCAIAGNLSTSGNTVLNLLLTVTAVFGTILIKRGSARR